jgi:4-amino-4-deoxychorismate lyase
MSLLVETIKVEHGKLLNITYHNERMERSLSELFGKKGTVYLEKIIDLPQSVSEGIYKCRVIYDEKNTEIEFVPYIHRKVRSLRLVYDDSISYSYKFADRLNLNRLFDLRGDCDDILIIKNGMVTDSSYANVILKNQNGNWVTPSTYLLKGTRRSCLLNDKSISEADISAADLDNYSEFRIINAMIGIDDSESIPVRELLLV